MRIAIFGDVGGHYRALAAGLEEVGCKLEKHQVPADLVVIQVGDLVHKGPDSSGCVALADHMKEANPERWFQLLGNHEGQYLGGPAFWGDDLSDDFYTVDTLQRWWKEKTAGMAIAVRDERLGDVLVTHAGLSHLWWSQVLGGIQNAKLAADILNGLQAPDAFHPGSMLHKAPPGEGGVAWAWSLGELYEPWQRYTKQTKKPLPFSQAHGHCSSYWWDRKRNDITNSGYSGTMKIDHKHRHYTLKIGGKTFISTDPGWGKTASTIQYPYMLEGTVL